MEQACLYAECNQVLYSPKLCSKEAVPLPACLVTDPRPVQRLLQQRSPFLLEHHFDEPVVRMMLRLPDESSAMSVLDELGANDLSMVRWLRHV